MAEETETKSSTKHLFDDSDDSDSDEEFPSTQPINRTTMIENQKGDKNDNLKDQKASNAQLFGSDDSDSDEDPPNATHNENNEEDSDVEFQEQDADIVGRKAPTPPPTANIPMESNASSSSYKHIAVYNHAVPQVESKMVSLHLAQLPKILGIQSEAFSSSTYNAAIEDAEFKGRTASMIRWRYIQSKDGAFERDPHTNRLKKESNAKIIKWSDGTYGLVVGDEVFDMDEFSYLPKGMGNKKVGPGGTNMDKGKDFLYMTQKAKAILDEDTHETRNIGTILQAVSHLTSKFIPRPATLQSAAHKTFVLHERSKVMKRAKIAEYVTFVDPEKQKAERIRNKEDLIKQEKRSGDMYKTGGKKRIGMHRDYLEDDEDDDRYDSVNIKRLKRGDDDDMDYGSDKSEEEDEWIKRKTKRVPGYGKRNVDNDEDEMESEEDMDDSESQDEEEEIDEDDDVEINLRKKSTGTSSMKQKAQATIFDDDDDDDSD